MITAELIEAAAEALKAEAANRGKIWEGPGVWVNSVLGEDTASGGFSFQPNRDISSRYFSSIEEAMLYIIQEGGDGVAEDLCSYYAEF